MICILCTASEAACWKTYWKHVEIRFGWSGWELWRNISSLITFLRVLLKEGKMTCVFRNMISWKCLMENVRSRKIAIDPIHRVGMLLPCCDWACIVHDAVHSNETKNTFCLLLEIWPPNTSLTYLQHHNRSVSLLFRKHSRMGFHKSTNAFDKGNNCAQNYRYRWFSHQPPTFSHSNNSVTPRHGISSHSSTWALGAWMALLTQTSTNEWCGTNPTIAKLPTFSQNRRTWFRIGKLFTWLIVPEMACSYRSSYAFSVLQNVPLFFRPFTSLPCHFVEDVGFSQTSCLKTSSTALQWKNPSLSRTLAYASWLATNFHRSSCRYILILFSKKWRTRLQPQQTPYTQLVLTA